MAVGQPQQLAAIVSAESERSGSMHITERWLGGLLTNFATVKKQLRKLKELEAEDVISRTVIPETPGQWRNTAEAERWTNVETVLEVVNEALEAARRDKVIGGALDAWPVVTAPAELLAPFEGLDAAEVFRTSGAELKAGGEAVTVEVKTADYPKCARSWRRVPDVGSDADYPDLSARDADAVRWLDAQKA